MSRVKMRYREFPLETKMNVEIGSLGSGTPVRVVRLAPLGDPMQVTLHGYHISLRRTEARSILVDPA